jgi:[acyl-carrier-protein] S-malonyltransferase
VSLALLFAGQGTQHVAMLPWLKTCPEAEPTLALIAAQLGADWRDRLALPDWAYSNAVAQPLLTGLGVAAWQGLAPRLPTPAVVAGYSVGELAAFCVTGVFDAHTAMALAADRAAAMDRAAVGIDTGLMSVQGLDRAAQRAACARYGIFLAIRLAADRAVLGGLSEALTAAERGLSAEGVRCTRLAVGIASHTPLMSAAAIAFDARLNALNLSPPDSVLVCNHTGAPEHEPSRLKQWLARQVETPVLWDSCMDAIAERRVRCVLEVGPGNALTKIWRDRYPHIPARSVDEFRSADAVAGWAHGKLR